MPPAFAARCISPWVASSLESLVSREEATHGEIHLAANAGGMADHPGPVVRGGPMGEILRPHTGLGAPQRVHPARDRVCAQSVGRARVQEVDRALERIGLWEAVRLRQQENVASG